MVEIDIVNGRDLRRGSTGGSDGDSKVVKSAGELMVFAFLYFYCINILISFSWHKLFHKEYLNNYLCQSDEEISPKSSSEPSIIQQRNS